jgi:transcription antitermination factor NusG
MKTMMKKCGVILACAAALFMVVALVIGCPQPGSVAPAYQPSAGMGAVQFNFNLSRAARSTFIPDVSDIVVAVYEVSITPTPSQYISGTFDILAADMGVPIELDPDTYDLTIVAFIDLAKDQPVASVVGEELIVDPGEVADATITLKVIDPTDPELSGDGTFSWKITDFHLVQPNVTKATMDLTRIGTIGDVDPDGFPVDLLDNDNLESSAPVLSGYYYVDFELENDVENITRSFRHILHIYTSMTTTFTYAFTEDHFIKVVGTGAKFAIDIDDIEDIPLELIDSDDAAVIEGQKITLMCGYDDPLDIDDVDAEEETITVDNASAYDSIQWFIGTTLLGTTEGVSADGTEITIVAGEGAFIDPRMYELTVVGIKGGVPYYTYIYIFIEAYVEP